jgi:hypothetical protein
MPVITGWAPMAGTWTPAIRAAAVSSVRTP